MKTALITRDAVQDRSYLTELLFSKNHVLLALIRKIYFGKCLEKSNRMAICKNIRKKRVGDLSYEDTKNDIKQAFQAYGISF